MDAPQTQAGSATRLARVGADPRDEPDLREKKALLVLLAVLILPVSLVWGASYLAFGSRVGVLPFIYFAISLGSLMVFSRTRRFGPFLTVQLLDVLLHCWRSTCAPPSPPRPWPGAGCSFGSASTPAR